MQLKGPRMSRNLVMKAGEWSSPFTFHLLPPGQLRYLMEIIRLWFHAYMAEMEVQLSAYKRLGPYLFKEYEHGVRCVPVRRYPQACSPTMA